MACVSVATLGTDPQVSGRNRSDFCSLDVLQGTWLVPVFTPPGWLQVCRGARDAPGWYRLVPVIWIFHDVLGDVSMLITSTKWEIPQPKAGDEGDMGCPNDRALVKSFCWKRIWPASR